MKLRHIFCTTDYVSEWSKMMRWEYYRSSRFICYYLVRRIRQYKFETDGTFRTIEIQLGSDEPCRVVRDGVLEVHLPIDEKRYEAVRDTTDYSYYIENLRKGFEKASKFKHIPLDELNRYLDEFIADGYRNEWQYTKATFKEYGIRVEINAILSTFRLRLNAEFYSIKSKKHLCGGLLISTMADEFYVYGRGDKKDTIRISNGKVGYFKGYQEKYPFIVFDVMDIINGIYKPEFYDYSKFLNDRDRLYYESKLDTCTYKPDSPYFDETKY